MKTIKRRQDFLAAARGLTWATRGAVVQARERDDGEPARAGYTVTRKLGNAVNRNRIKRRLRAATQQIWAQRARTGYDYVIIGRHSTATRPFEKLISDIDLALQHLNNGETQSPRRSGKGNVRSGKTSDPADKS